MLNSIKTGFRVFYKHDFFSSISSSWSTGALFLTIVGGLGAGLMGIAGLFTPLSFIPPILTLLSPYLLSFTLSVGIYSYFHSLYSNYQQEVDSNAKKMFKQLAPVKKEYDLNKENVKSKSDLNQMIAEVDKNIIEGYLHSTSYMIGRSGFIDRANRIVKIQVTRTLLLCKDIKKNNTSFDPVKILKGCILYQREHAQEKHKKNNSLASWGITKSNFVNACDNVIDTSKIDQTERDKSISQYQSFQKQHRFFYKTIVEKNQMKSILASPNKSSSLYSP